MAMPGVQKLSKNCIKKCCHFWQAKNDSILSIANGKYLSSSFVG